MNLVSIRYFSYVDSFSYHSHPYSSSFPGSIRTLFVSLKVRRFFPFSQNRYPHFLNKFHTDIFKFNGNYNEDKGKKKNLIQLKTLREITEEIAYPNNENEKINIITSIKNRVFNGL